MNNMTNPIEHKTDFVILLDATGTMGEHLDQIKASLFRLLDNYRESAMKEKDWLGEEKTEINMILFRDYAFDEKPMEYLGFQPYPAIKGKLDSALTRDKFVGGGDYPECGLEALCLGMDLSFCPMEGQKDRQIFILISDAEALELGERANAKGYPNSLKGLSFDDLVTRWNNRKEELDHNLLDVRRRRLVLFTPGGEIYEKLSESLSNTASYSFDYFLDDFNSFNEIINHLLGGSGPLI